MTNYVQDCTNWSFTTLWHLAIKSFFSNFASSSVKDGISLKANLDNYILNNEKIYQNPD